MDSEIVDAVTEWESRSFSGGYAGLHDLADEGFTGAVTEGMAWVFMVNGRAIGVFDGSIEQFEDADGTAYEAPDRALPLLFAMKETGGETRAKYYTNDTSLSEADATLSSGSFTGYIELSENVLSGDYYVVYHGGRSMSVAFVGNSRQLHTGDEAFEKADDEVGIYEVKDVDIDVIEIPEPETAIDEAESDQEATDEVSRRDSGADEADQDEGDADVTERDRGRDRSETGSGGTPSDADQESAEPTVSDEDDRDVGDETDGDVTDAADSDVTDAVESAATAADDAEPTTPDSDDREDAAGNDPAATESNESAGDESAPDSAAASEPEADPMEAVDPAEIDATGGAAEAGEGAAAEAPSEDRAPDDGVLSDEEQWREARSIPPLNPEKSSTRSGTNDRSSGQENPRQSRDESTSGPRRPQRSEAEQAQSAKSGRRSQRSGTSRRSTGDVDQRGQQLEQLRERLEALQQAKEEAESEKERLAAEREELQEERDQLEQERDKHRERAEQLEDRVEDLEAQIDRLQRQLEDAQTDDVESTSERTMSRQAVLDGTNLFVRYGSKGGATLEKAHSGEVDREAVEQNLRLEYHSSFETDGLRVEGQPYEEFLHETIEYEFVQWVITELLYEIQDTGHEASLRELYDSIPKIDRAELHGQANVVYQEDGQENREQQSFDVVLRDRMGNPLIVADVNESRDAATEDMMTSLIESARRVKQTSDSLGAAIFVTASFFEPGALETAADATGGGLLSRSKRKSFVKLSRKSGFHLCLVETRNGDFHVNVPEL